MLHSPLSLETVDTLSLYVHIPFCSAKCDYCDFFSYPGISEEKKNRVIREVFLQAEHLLAQMGNPVIDTVFVGGGTPNSLSANTLETLLSGLDQLMGNPPAEFSFEANPEFVTFDQLTELSDAGVTRLSIGIQSFSDRYLGFLGRAASEIINRTALEEVRSSWKGDFNIDLITEIPGQSAAEQRKDIDAAAAYSPDHLSLYSLHVEEATPLYNRMKGSVPRSLKGGSSVDISGYMRKKGYNRYEVSNYSLPGKECLHNLRYWNMRPYLGIGPGAVSTVPGQNGVLRVENPKDLDRFLTGEKSSWGSSATIITPKEFLTEYLMMGLRLTEGIYIDTLENIFGINFFETFSGPVLDWTSRGYAIQHEHRLNLTPDGMDLLNPLLLQVMDTIETLSLETISWPPASP